MKKNNKKGFTLAELLIVVAIIGVLAAISIPVFSAKLESSREAVDAANIRSAYAEAMADAITDGSLDTSKSYYTGIALKQETAGWQNSFDFPTNLTAGTTEPDKNGTFKITNFNTSTGVATCNLVLN